MADKQDGLLPEVLRLGLSSAFHNKTILPGYDKRAYGDSFISQAISPQQLTAHITQGHAFTMGAYAGVSRKKDTFVSGQVMGLDLDKNISVDDCLAVDFIRQHAYLIYPTPSSGKPDDNGDPIFKSRVVFILDTPVTDRLAWERLQRALIWHCSILSPDVSCKDAARLFYGSETPDYITQDRVLPVAIVERLAQAMQDAIGERIERDSVDNERIRQQNRAHLADDDKKRRYYNYALTALDNMASDLSSMTGGGRNNTLNTYGWKAGNFVGADMIASSECESILRNAALASGLSQHEISNTLYRAIRDGESTPVDLKRLDEEWEAKRTAWRAEREKQRNRASDINTTYQQQKQATLIEFEKYQVYLGSEAGQHRMLRSLHEEFMNGYHISWWDTDHIPLGHLSAIMNLNNTRSSTGLVLGRMHHAIKQGKLSHALFSIPLVAEAINLSVRVVSNAFIELEQGGYIRFVDTCSLYTILAPLYKSMGQESAATPYLNATPARLYALNFDIEHLNRIVYQQLVIKKTEQYHRQTVATTTPQLADDLGLSLDEYESLHTLDSILASDKLSKKAQTELRIELEGESNGIWRGWKHALRSDYQIPIEWDRCETIKDVRGAILRHWVTMFPQNSRKRLSRLLGCSDTTVDNIMRELDIVSVRQDRKLEIKSPFDDLRPTMKQLQQDETAEIWGVSCRVKSDSKQGYIWTKVLSSEYAPRFYKNKRAEIDKVLFLYIVPSFQYLKSVASWQLNQQRMVVIVAYWLQVKYADLLVAIETTPEHFVDDMLEPESRAPKTDNTPAEDKQVITQHIYTEHTPAFKRDQVALRVFMLTPYTVIGDAIVDDSNTVIYQATGQARQADIIRYLLQQHRGKVMRPSHEYFDKEIEDYDDELNAEYKQERLNMLSSLVEVPDFDLPEDKVIQMPLDTPQPERVPDSLQQAHLDFYTQRMEREKQSTESRFAFIRETAQADVACTIPDCIFTDRFGYENTIRDGVLYVDGIRQRLTADTLAYLKTEIRKSA